MGNIVLSKSGTKNTGDADYEPPPHGGGSCITTRDCYYGKGACVAGKCRCEEPLTGSYCQLYRPDRSSLSPLAKREQEAAASKFHGAVNENRIALERKASDRARELEEKASRRSRRSGEFGFAFGKGPPLTRAALPKAPEEARSMRYGGLTAGGGAAGSLSLPRAHAATASSKGEEDVASASGEGIIMRARESPYGQGQCPPSTT